MRKILITFVLLISFQLAHSETITLKDGKTIEADIVEREDGYIKIDVIGVAITYYFDEIESIDGKRISPILSEKTAVYVTDKKKTPLEIFEKYASSVVLIETLRNSKYKIGMGFIIREDGIIVTNFHVVGGAESIKIRLKNGEIYSAVSVGGYDPVRDICVFRVNAENLPAIPIGNHKNLKENEEIISISFSKEGEQYYSKGAFLNRKDIYDNIFLQVTLGGGPGDSGSPVFNLEGELIGIYSFGDARMRNWSFAIPIEDIKNMVFPDREISITEFSARADMAYVFLNDGQNSFGENDLMSAIQSYKQAISLNPNFAEAYARLATAYVHNRNFDMGLVAVKKAIELEPDYVELYSNLASAALLNNMQGEALIAAKKAISLDPQYVISYDILALIYQIRGEINAAIEVLKKAIAIDDSYCSAYTHLADIYFERGDHETAKKYCAQARELGCQIPSHLNNF